MHGALREYVKKDVARLLDVDIKLNAATSSNIKKSFHQNLIFSPVSVCFCALGDYYYWTCQVTI